MIYGILFLALLTHSHGKDSNLCSIGGYFSGVGDNFMSGITSHIMTQKKLINTPSCSIAWNKARDLGVLFSKKGQTYNQADAEIVEEAGRFSAMIYDAIIKDLKL